MYVDSAGLSRYRQDFDAWARRSLLPKDAAAARVRTAKAGAVSFVPVQETPLDVSVDFLFSETPPAEGDKSPSNPSSITGVSSIKLLMSGKNLLPYVFNGQGTKVANGITFTDNRDGTVTVNGTAEADVTYRLTPNEVANNWLKSGVTYTLSGCPSGGSSSTYYYAQYNGVGRDIGNGFTYTADTNKPSAGDIVIRSGISVTNLIFKPQLEIGSSATGFEKGIVNSYTLPLGSTYYGGTVDLATGVMTVTRQYMVATNADNITWIGTNCVAWSYPSGRDAIGRAVGTEVCSHFPFSGAWDGSFAHFYATTSGGLYLFNPDWTSSTSRQYFIDQYNNGTPVTACYQLANPFTVQLTPTEILSLTQSSDYDPRVNTVYSDAQAVQVGYLKHPSAASADLRNAVVSLGGGV